MKAEKKNQQRHSERGREMEEVLSVVENKVCTEPHQRFIY